MSPICPNRDIDAKSCGEAKITKTDLGVQANSSRDCDAQCSFKGTSASGGTMSITNTQVCSAPSREEYKTKIERERVREN